MRNINCSLWLLIAGATQKQLAQDLRFALIEIERIKGDGGRGSIPRATCTLRRPDFLVPRRTLLAASMASVAIPAKPAERRRLWPGGHFDPLKRFTNVYNIKRPEP